MRHSLLIPAFDAVKCFMTQIRIGRGLILMKSQRSAVKIEHVIEHPTCQQLGCTNPAQHYQRHLGDTMSMNFAKYFCDHHSALDIGENRHKIVIWDDIFYPSIELTDGMITSQCIGKLTLY